MSDRIGMMDRFLMWLAGWAGKPIIALLYSTVRIRTEPDTQRKLDDGSYKPGIYAFWHSHQLSTLWRFRRTGVAIMVSRSKDGEYIARVAASAGYRPVRGSSSRAGAEGLMEMVNIVKAGGVAAFTPDGPRGPRYSVKPGALALARITGVPVTPVAVGLSRFWELPSWDRFRIPKPFSRAYAILGEPMRVPAGTSDEDLAKLASEFSARLQALEQQADLAAKRKTG